MGVCLGIFDFPGPVRCIPPGSELILPVGFKRQDRGGNAAFRFVDFRPGSVRHDRRAVCLSYRLQAGSDQAELLTQRHVRNAELNLSAGPCYLAAHVAVSAALNSPHQRSGVVEPNTD